MFRHGRESAQALFDVVSVPKSYRTRRRSSSAAWHAAQLPVPRVRADEAQPVTAAEEGDASPAGVTVRRATHELRLLHERTACPVRLEVGRHRRPLLDDGVVDADVVVELDAGVPDSVAVGIGAVPCSAPVVADPDRQVEHADAAGDVRALPDIRLVDALASPDRAVAAGDIRCEWVALNGEVRVAAGEVEPKRAEAALAAVQSALRTRLVVEQDRSVAGHAADV